MKKKNILMIALSLCLVAIIAVGGTLAYFTDSTPARQNVLTMGELGITIRDENNNDYKVVHDGRENGITYEGVIPGDTLEKIVGVQVNEGSQDCYVAMRVVISGPSDEVAGVGKWQQLGTQLMETAGQNNWLATSKETSTGVEIDFYCPEAASAGAYLPLFDTVEIPLAWGNEIANDTFTIEVSAAAVQADHMDAPGYTYPVVPNETMLALRDLLDKIPAVADGTTQG